MIRLRDISEDTALFPWNKSTPYPAIQSTIAVALALLVGELTGHQSAASIAAGSAFTVGFAVFHEAMASTLLSMGVLTLGIASGTLAGSLGAHWTPLVLLLCVVAAVNYGFLAGLGNTAGWIGQQSAIFVIVSSYFANGVHYALGRSAMVMIGGALQMAIYAASTMLRRHAASGSPPVPPVWRQLGTRSRQLWTCFRDELSWHADTTSYVLRLCITLALSTALYRHLHWRNGYWAPMTALLVLKPKWANTLSRGVARLTGTLVGAGVCALLALHPLFDHSTYFLLIAGTACLCFALQAVNYALFSAILTMYTVFLFAFGGFSERSAADLRLINTAVGGLLALLVDFAALQIGSRFHPISPPASPTALEQ
ncbi:MAG: FUSC family protein [Janthinobacterium lividum]